MDLRKEVERFKPQWPFAFVFEVPMEEKDYVIDSKEFASVIALIEEEEVSTPVIFFDPKNLYQIGSIYNESLGGDEAHSAIVICATGTLDYGEFEASVVVIKELSHWGEGDVLPSGATFI